MIDATTSTDLLHVAGTRGRNSAIKAEISATSTATTSQQESLKALAIKRLQRNKARNESATKGEILTQQKADKPADLLHGFDSQNSPHITDKIPARLIDAATRVCTELWNDPPEAVQEMMEDLCWNDPKDWEVLILHFEAQLPPTQPQAIPALVTCSGCSHAAPSPHHPGIIHCKAGVESGAATDGWFDTDRHLCDRKEARI